MKSAKAIANAQIIFLTGAGASIPLGLPDTHGFLNRLINSARIRGFAAEKGTKAELVSELTEINQRPDADIEKILSDLDERLEGIEALKNDATFVRFVSAILRPMDSAKLYRSYLEHLREIIYDEVVLAYQDVDPQSAADLYRAVLAGFPRLFHDIPDLGNTIPFFTTNYDLAIEEAASDLNIRVVDGFRDAPSGPVWDPDTFASYIEDQSRINVALVKLHGSVNWAQDPSSPGTIAKIPRRMTRNPGGFKNVLLYPTLGSKQVRIPPYRANYDCLRQCLLGAKLVIVIGSSFRDPELNEELRRGFDDNKDLHLVAISPGANNKVIAQIINAEGADNRIAGIRGKFGDSTLQPLNQLLMTNHLRDFARLACGVQQTQSHFHFGGTFDLPVQAPKLLPSYRPSLNPPDLAR